MITKAEREEKELKGKLGKRSYRLNHLYHIVDKYAEDRLFQMNPQQERMLVLDLWYLEIVLKARQLGISTGIEIFGLDMCLFNSNTEFGIIDATLPDAKKKIAKCRYAYNLLPDWLKEHIKLVKDNEQEMVFSNGSRITADTSFRGSTVNILHISEYGKICKVDPLKAKEIKTGALNTLAAGQFVFIESTAEDAEGIFFEMVQRAEKLKESGQELSALDYKFFFFPWFDDPSYSLKKPDYFFFSNESNEYFNKLEEMGIVLTNDQKYWYVKKRETQDEDMKREFPSNSREAFEVSMDDKYYKELMIIAEQQHRVTEFGIDPTIPVDIDMDLGRGDQTPVIFSQVVGKEIRIVDYFEVSGEAINVIISEIQKKGYNLGKIWLPHDARNEVLHTEKSIYQQMVDVFSFKGVDIVEKASIEVGISEVRRLFPQFWFRRSTTALLIDHVEKYSKKWNESLGKYMGPRHDIHSHSCDALRGLSMRYKDLAPQSLLSKGGKNFVSKRTYKSAYQPMGGTLQIKKRF